VSHPLSGTPFFKQRLQVTRETKVGGVGGSKPFNGHFNGYSDCYLSLKARFILVEEGSMRSLQIIGTVLDKHDRQSPMLSHPPIHAERGFDFL